tara:strand:- start:3757 stop:4203 length:447 start_codon:yes stop_codon:yes gene_type:complete
MRNFLLIFAVAFGLISCEKSAGEGGTSVIEGQVYKLYTSEIVVNELDSFGNDTTYKIIDTLYYQLDEGEDVYIIYDDNEEDIYDDKFKTDYQGRYRFEYLRKGEYTIYTHADSSDVDMTYTFPVFKHVNISSNNSTNTVDNFIIEKNQ